MPDAFATAEGTARYASRSTAFAAPGHFRDALGLKLSSLGLGTYLGRENDEDDRLYEEAARAALRGGVNVLDTAINYRCQRSERSLGRALAGLVAAGEIARDEVVVATKGGYVPFDGRPPASRQEMAEYVSRAFVEPGIAAPGEIVGGIHCMAPAYLRDQIGRSLANLGLETIDVYYLHNPEQQLSEVPRAEFLRRFRAACEALEEAVAERRIRAYGTATWNGYRANPDGGGYLSLSELAGIAREVGGEQHHFRVVQLPYNLAMHEAFTLANQKIRANGREGWVSLLEAARAHGIAVVTSASILQGKLATGLPDDLERAFPNLGADARRALQFVRSTPGVTTALVGMRRPEHVAANLDLVRVPPASERDLMKLFGQP